MSGGSYDYGYRRIDDLADSIKKDGYCHAASPAKRSAFKELLAKVARAAKAVEWNDSGDGDEAEEALIDACLAPGAALAWATVEAKRVHAELGKLIEEGSDDE